MNDQNIRLTFRSGGWVLVISAIVLIGVVIWAVAPAVFRLAILPPGDNQTIESYEFDLSNLQLDRELVVPAMRHRNMSPILTDPIVLSPEEIQLLNNSKRDPLVVSNDLVIGVVINGEARAYPLHFLHVHEIINDTLGGTPIAIMWHWPSGHIVVYERNISGNIAQFANSGLVGNGGMLFYKLGDRVGNEQLFASMLGSSVTGESVVLSPVIHDVVSWKRWHSEHPKTTSLGPDKQMKKRYRKASPELYFLTEKIYFPTDPIPISKAAPKTTVIVISIGEIERVYSLPDLLDVAGDDGKVIETVGGVKIVFTVDSHPMSVSVR
ncbi:MAG: DUF3179 domain-containing (seleno)protein, partial [Phycisphaerales bacterium]|nr:DUF3179 domain-containing (seleno)protein [Phycisphaerales bacterium]